jgi:hypothetical protein
MRRLDCSITTLGDSQVSLDCRLGLLIFVTYLNHTLRRFAKRGKPDLPILTILVKSAHCTFDYEVRVEGRRW